MGRNIGMQYTRKSVPGMKKAAQKLGGRKAEDVSGRKSLLLSLPNVTVRQ
jgi:hypothetical protein